MRSRRRAAVQSMRKEKPADGTADGKLTMYDLIYDTVSPRYVTCSKR